MDSKLLLWKDPAIKASTHRFVPEHQWLHRCLGCPLNLRRLQSKIEAALPAHLVGTLRRLVGEQVVVCTIVDDDVPLPAPTGSVEAKASLAEFSKSSGPSSAWPDTASFADVSRSSGPPVARRGTLDALWTRRGAATQPVATPGGSSKPAVFEVGDDLPVEGKLVIDE